MQARGALLAEIGADVEAERDHNYAYNYKQHDVAIAQEVGLVADWLNSLGCISGALQEARFGALLAKVGSKAMHSFQAHQRSHESIHIIHITDVDMGKL